MGADQIKNPGFVIYTRINRPPRDLVDPFKEFGTTNVVDSLGRFGAMDYTIKPLIPGVKLVGTAITVRSRPGDNLLIYKAIELAEPGDIIVIGNYSYETSSTWGDITSMMARARGIAGVVTDGLARDIAGIREVGLPIFARGLIPNSPMKDGPGDINIPVSCGGVIVNPGDVVVGDDDGVVVVPKALAESTIAKTRDLLAKEAKTMQNIREGRVIPDWVDSGLSRGGAQIIDGTWD
jgi:regulator of RNase E activity RraA